MMPARDTVAGEALRRSSTSKLSVTFGLSIGMRSLFARVRILLSSMTVLRFSIQMASTGPSSTIQVKYFLSLFALRQSCAKMPSVHSLAMTSSAPNICGDVMALGFMRASRCGWPTIGGRSRLAVQLPRALCRVSVMRVLPTPDGPTDMTEWRTSAISYTWTIFRIQLSCFCRPDVVTTPAMAASTSLCCCFSACMPGKRSSSVDMKSGTSSATNLERFISRRERMRSSSSGLSCCCRLDAPAVRKTARMLRRPKS
mmetsp:Transcript_17846/g.51940  ORF Transcript_17846/g.51940 Transcript_17846/m.51940 type:complete len:256 (-) Transcript_17846:49-816(-)